MAEQLDPRLAELLAAWREESATAPDAAALDSARLAMRAAVQEQTPVQVWPVSAWRDRLSAALAGARSHPRLVAATLAPLAVVGLTAAGWSSPSGSPLHFVELSRERTELALPGADRAGLELSFAERRLRDAARGEAPAASLREADGLLSDARRDLPPNPPARLSTRLESDVERLNHAAQTTGVPPPAPGAPPTHCPDPSGSSPSGPGAALRLSSPCAAEPSPTPTARGGSPSSPSP
ncbi:MAG: hypothetical protein NVS3B18_09150 [Candidatus Dormibacteria bacterium]